jgi:Ca2+-binding EF-hand superfamily protein
MLKGKQKKLDKNKDGKISGEDFKMMKAKSGKDVDIDLIEKIVNESIIGKGALKTKVKKDLWVER